MTRRVYTDEERQEALALYVEHGACEAARLTGIPQKTLSSWAARAGVQSDAPAKTQAAVDAARLHATEQRERLRALMLDKAVDLLERMDEPHVDFKGAGPSQVTYPRPSASACASYATAAAILLDKLRLEEGSATSRQEVIAPDERRQRVAERLDELAARRQGKPAAAGN